MIISKDSPAYRIVNHFAELNGVGIGWNFTYEMCIEFNDFIIILNLN